MEEKSKLFYDDLVGNGYKLPDYETFKTSLQDQKKADAFYKDLSGNGFKLPDFDTFYGIFKPTEPVQDVSAPVQEASAPVAQEERGAVANFLGGINQTALNIPADIMETWAIASAFTERQLSKLGVPGASPDVKATDVGAGPLKYMDATEEYRGMVNQIAPVSDDFKSTFAGGVSQGLGQALGMLATGGGSRATQIAKMAKSTGGTLTSIVSAGKELLKNVGSKQGLVGGSMNASANYKQAIQEGASEEQALQYGIENMVVGSVMENLPIQSMFSRISKMEPNAKILDIVKNGLIGAGEEGVTEGFQTTYENLSANRVYEVNREMLDGVGDAAAVGGTVGFILNSALSALTGRRSKVPVSEQPVIDKAIEETQAKIEKVEENNSNIEETVIALEGTSIRTLNNGATDLDFIQNPDGSIEYSEDGLSSTDAEAKKLLLEMKYPNISFELVDNTKSDDPYAEADFTIKGNPKQKPSYSKGDQKLSESQADLLIQSAESLADLEGIQIQNNPELEARFAEKATELQPKEDEGIVKSEPEQPAVEDTGTTEQPALEDVQQEPVDQGTDIEVPVITPETTKETTIQENETIQPEKPSERSEGKGTPKKITGDSVKKVGEIAKKKRPFFQDIKKKFGFPANAKVKTIADAYDAAKIKEVKTKEDTDFIEAVDKAIETEYIKPATQKGKVPLSQRALPESHRQALAQPVGKESLYDIASQWIIEKRGGLQNKSIWKEVFGGKYPREEMSKRVRMTSKDGVSVEKMAEQILEDGRFSEMGIDVTELRSAIIDVIKNNETTDQIASRLNDKYSEKVDKKSIPQEKAIASKYTPEQWSELSYSDKADHLNDFYELQPGEQVSPETLELLDREQIEASTQEVVDAYHSLDVMTDEELQEYADGYEKSEIEVQKSKIKDIIKDLKDQLNDQSQGIIVDFEARAKADIKFYNTLRKLITEYARLKGMQFNEFITDLQKLLGQSFAKEDKAFLKSMWDEEKKSIPKKNTMTENPQLNQKDQFKQGLAELISAREKLAKERLKREREKAKEAVKAAKDKDAEKLKQFENIKKTIVEFIKMDLSDIPVDNFTKGEVNRILTQINRARTDWTLNQSIEEAYKVLAESGTRKRLSEAKKKAIQARKNIKSGKIGTLEPNSSLDQMLKINPKIIPQRVFDQYESILDQLGARKTVLSPKEKSLLSDQVTDIMTEVDNDNSLLENLKDEYDNYPDKKDHFSETLTAMLKDGIINDSEVEFMKNRKSEIVEKESSTKEEESQEDLNDAISAIITKKSSIPDPGNNFSKDENKIIRFFKSISKSDLTGMNLRELGSVYGLIGNLENNYVPHLAEKLRQKIEGERNAQSIIPIINRYKGKWVDFLSGTKAGVKNLFFGQGNTNAMKEKIRSNPLSYIDQSLRNFRNTDFYDATFRKMASSYSAFDSDFKTVLEKLLNAESRLKNQFESRSKLMMIAIQMEFESNPNAKVNSAKDWLDATINDKNSIYTKDAKNKLQEIFDSISTNGELDLAKAEKSLSPEEISAQKAIREINEYLTPIADWTATVIRGNRVPIHENYIHLPRAIKGGEILNYDPKTSGSPLNPSTKAGALIERTGKTHAISFDIFENVLSGAKGTLMDYHMTPSVKEMNRTFSKVESEAKTEKEIEAARFIREIYEEVIENTIGVTMARESVPDKIFNEVARKGYQAVLSGIGKSITELGSNAIFAGAFKLNETTNGIKILRDVSSDKMASIAKNVGSTHSSRLYDVVGMSSKHADFGGYSTKELSKMSGLDEGVFTRMFQSLKDNKYYRAVDSIQAALLSKPDQLVSRPLWAGVFDQEFVLSTGNSPDYDKIASNDQEYMESNSKAISDARSKADDTVTEAVASSNPFDGILKNNQNSKSKGFASATGKYFNAFNSYMTRFAIYEYNSAVKGVHALVGNGSMGKADGAKLLAALSIRLMMYDLMTETILGLAYQAIAGLFIDQKEDEKEAVEDILTRSFLSSMIMLTLNRNMGNVAKAPINYGVEMINQKYGEGITYTGKYDPFNSSVVYPLLPVERSPGGKDIPQQLMENTAGPMTPITKTAFRTLTVFDRAVNSKTEKARERNTKELLTRTPFEIAGNLGYIPAYKDIRKVMLNYWYNAKEQAEEEQRRDAKERKLGER